jgi:hypothetical protein
MTTDLDLPTLDALHAQNEHGAWVAYAYEGESNSGRHRYSLCRNEDDMTNHTCLGQLKADTEDKVRALAEYIAALHNAFPALSARIKELEANARDRSWNRIDLETMIQNEHKLYADAHERMVKVEERNKLLTETLRGIRQEKAAALDETPTFHPMRKEREKQIAWIDHVLRGEP